MPPPTPVLCRLSATSLCKSQWTPQNLSLRNIADSATLSAKAKIGLISAGVVIFVLLVLILVWYLRRPRDTMTLKNSLKNWKSARGRSGVAGTPRHIDRGAFKGKPTPYPFRNLGPRSFSSTSRYWEGSYRMSKVETDEETEFSLLVDPRDVWKPSKIEQNMASRHQDEVLEAEASEPVKTIYCETQGCDRTFTSQSDYNHHKRYHIKPQKCPHCDKSFGTKRDLRRHARAVHPDTVDEDVERHFCTVAGCKYAADGDDQLFFSRKDHWKRHMEQVHKQGIEKQPTVT